MMSHYQWQHIYAPMLYGLLGIKYRVNDILAILWKRKSGDVRLKVFFVSLTGFVSLGCGD